jgi:uncharacterized protein (DUF305 family)
MPPAPRHSRPKTPRKPAVKIGVPVLAAATLAGVAAAFVFLTGGSAGSAASTSASHSKISVASTASSLTSDDMMIDVHHKVAARTVRDNARTIRRKYLAKLAAARLAQKKAAEQAAKQQAAAAAQPTASPSPAASSAGSSSTDAAHSALGVCIRNAEEGGSYAWGPGNGGGAYQFVLGTWENYGGSASEFGVAGPAYQDQIFDNAIAAGGASNWTAYDGC